MAPSAPAVAPSCRGNVATGSIFRSKTDDRRSAPLVETATPPEPRLVLGGVKTDPRRNPGSYEPPVLLLAEVMLDDCTDRDDRLAVGNDTPPDPVP